MSRLTISILILALCAACASTTPAGAPTESPSAGTASSSEEPTDCPEEGCPVPDCQGGVVVNAQIDHVADAIGVTDVESDVEDWLHEIGGAGEAAGIPTLQDRIAFLVSRDRTDVALLWYVTDGHGGWLRASYVACQSELNS